FFMGEYANMILASAMMVTLFFGGWTLPVFGLDQPATTLLGGVAHIVIFLAKLFFFMLIFIWVRWMWPRFRYDQLMDLGWRRFIPLALANILVTALVLWICSGTFHHDRQTPKTKLLGKALSACRARRAQNHLAPFLYE